MPILPVWLVSLVCTPALDTVSRYPALKINLSGESNIKGEDEAIFFNKKGVPVHCFSRHLQTASGPDIAGLLFIPSGTAWTDNMTDRPGSQDKNGVGTLFRSERGRKPAPGMATKIRICDIDKKHIGLPMTGRHFADCISQNTQIRLAQVLIQGGCGSLFLGFF